MKRLFTGLAAGGLLFLAGAGSALAQNDQMARTLPVHAYICSYNDGQDRDDLDEAAEAWSEFMDDEGVDNYAAWTLEKWAYGGDQDFDVIWLGAWRDGFGMGEGIDNYIQKGGEIAEGFGEVVTCASHLIMASVPYKLPPDGTPNDGILSFSNCNVRDGSTYEDVASMTAEWVDRIEDAGSTVAIYHWWPVYGGGGDDEADFLWVEAYSDFAQFGADFERVGNGGLWEEMGEQFESRLDCDSARVYIAKNRRFVNIRE
jgi:hypothetical protein